jgi:hypothetical protein
VVERRERRAFAAIAAFDDLASEIRFDRQTLLEITCFSAELFPQEKTLRHSRPLDVPFQKWKGSRRTLDAEKGPARCAQGRRDRRVADVRTDVDHHELLRRAVSLHRRDEVEERFFLIRMVAKVDRQEVTGGEDEIESENPGRDRRVLRAPSQEPVVHTVDEVRHRRMEVILPRGKTEEPAVDELVERFQL